MELTSLLIPESVKQRFEQMYDNQYGLARVSGTYQNIYKLNSHNGEILAQIAGRRSHLISSSEELPVVGDWVVISTGQHDQDMAIIHDILPRFSKLSRLKAGSEFGEQIIAANVDYVLIVMALNNDFNIRRLERYLIAVWESGANPIVVLNKEDLCEDFEEKLDLIRSVALDVPVLHTSATEDEGMDLLHHHLQSGKTYVLVGSSGVGKSTITNRLIGRTVQHIKTIRAGDDRGKHTTTTRSLFYLSNGSSLIDTPGMREFGLWDSEGGLEEGFKDIAQLAQHCRFRDCSHTSEPGCLVQASIDNKTLDIDRFRNYQKLLKEQAHFERKLDKKRQSVQKELYKKITKTNRANKKQKR